MSEYLDRYARRRSVCHRLPNSLKVAFTLATILCALTIPLDRWPLLGALLVAVYFGLTLAGVPLNYLGRRLLLFLPMMILLTISLPASQGFLRGWDLMGVIVLRSTVSLLGVIWLVNVLPFDELLVTLRRWKCPAILTAMLSFMYRFSYIMWDELERMQTARRVRCFGRGGLRISWRSRTQMMGMLLLRGLTRAERVHGAMCSRGWTGEIVHLEAATTDNESIPQA